MPGNPCGLLCKAKDVVAVLEELTSLYLAPRFIRSDNGPEFIAHACGAGAKTRHHNRLYRARISVAERFC